MSRVCRPRSLGGLAGRFDADQAERIIAACADRAALEALPINEFMDLWATG